MLGLNEGREYCSWVLPVYWKNLSMTNNPAAMLLAHAVLEPHGYNDPGCRNVELYINGECWGAYLKRWQKARFAYLDSVRAGE